MNNNILSYLEKKTTFDKNFKYEFFLNFKTKNYNKIVKTEQKLLFYENYIHNNYDLPFVYYDSLHDLLADNDADSDDGSFLEEVYESELFFDEPEVWGEKEEYIEDSDFYNGYLNFGTYADVPYSLELLEDAYLEKTMEYEEIAIWEETQDKLELKSKKLILDSSVLTESVFEVNENILQTQRLSFILEEAFFHIYVDLKKKPKWLIQQQKGIEFFFEIDKFFNDSYLIDPINIIDDFDSFVSHGLNNSLLSIKEKDWYLWFKNYMILKEQHLIFFSEPTIKFFGPFIKMFYLQKLYTDLEVESYNHNYREHPVTNTFENKTDLEEWIYNPFNNFLRYHDKYFAFNRYWREKNIIPYKNIFMYEATYRKIFLLMLKYDQVCFELQNLDNVTKIKYKVTDSSNIFVEKRKTRILLQKLKMKYFNEIFFLKNIDNEKELNNLYWGFIQKYNDSLSYKALYYETLRLQYITFSFEYDTTSWDAFLSSMLRMNTGFNYNFLTFSKYKTIHRKNNLLKKLNFFFFFDPLILDLAKNDFGTSYEINSKTAEFDFLTFLKFTVLEKDVFNDSSLYMDNDVIEDILDEFDDEINFQNLILLSQISLKKKVWNIYYYFENKFYGFIYYFQFFYFYFYGFLMPFLMIILFYFILQTLQKISLVFYTFFIKDFWKFLNNILFDKVWFIFLQAKVWVLDSLYEVWESSRNNFPALISNGSFSDLSVFEVLNTAVLRENFSFCYFWFDWQFVFSFLRFESFGDIMWIPTDGSYEWDYQYPNMLYFFQIILLWTIWIINYNIIYLFVLINLQLLRFLVFSQYEKKKTENNKYFLIDWKIWQNFSNLTRVTFFNFFYILFSFSRFFLFLFLFSIEFILLKSFIYYIKFFSNLFKYKHISSPLPFLISDESWQAGLEFFHNVISSTILKFYEILGKFYNFFIKFYYKIFDAFYYKIYYIYNIIFYNKFLISIRLYYDSIVLFISRYLNLTTSFFYKKEKQELDLFIKGKEKKENSKIIKFGWMLKKKADKKEFNEHKIIDVKKGKHFIEAISPFLYALIRPKEEDPGNIKLKKLLLKINKKKLNIKEKNYNLIQFLVKYKKKKFFKLKKEELAIISKKFRSISVVKNNVIFDPVVKQNKIFKKKKEKLDNVESIINTNQKVFSHSYYFLLKNRPRIFLSRIEGLTRKELEKRFPVDRNVRAFEFRKIKLKLLKDNKTYNKTLNSIPLKKTFVKIINKKNKTTKNITSDRSSIFASPVVSNPTPTKKLSWGEWLISYGVEKDSLVKRRARKLGKQYFYIKHLFARVDAFKQSNTVHFTLKQNFFLKKKKSFLNIKYWGKFKEDFQNHEYYFKRPFKTFYGLSSKKKPIIFNYNKSKSHLHYYHGFQDPFTSPIALKWVKIYEKNYRKILVRKKYRIEDEGKKEKKTRVYIEDYALFLSNRRGFRKEHSFCINNLYLNNLANGSYKKIKNRNKFLESLYEKYDC
jgi:hypothetical protein